jgi:hypothetical protein
MAKRYRMSLAAECGIFRGREPHDDDLCALFRTARNACAPAYFELPVVTLFGYLVFCDFANTLSLIGIGITIGAGLYMIQRERMAAKQIITVRAAPLV